jgi:Protein of unknown function (DUF1761)
MIYIVLNALPIIVAALAAVALGALWYRCAVSTSLLATVIAAQLWLGAILAGALILAPPKGSVWTMTLGSAFIIWIGFVLPALAASYRFRGIAWRTVGIDSGYWLAAMLLQATVMRLIGLVAPSA